jgi:hypothetical protein
MWAGVVVYTSAIPALKRLGWEDTEFKANLGYKARPCLIKKRTNKKACGIKLF